MSGEDYSKDIGKSAFILEWISILLVGILFVFCFWTVADIVIGILTTSDFSIRWYLLNDSILVHPALPLLIAFVLFLFEGRKRYRLIKEKPFASITGDQLVLNFGKNSFLWSQIRAVDLEGNRKLTITFLDKRKDKKRIFDLKWLQKKDFIHNLRSICRERNIPYHESYLTFSSQVKLFLNFLNRYPFV